MKMKLSVLIWLVVFMCLISCQGTLVFEEEKVFEGFIWNRFDIIEMEIPVEDENTHYDLKVKFMHTESYALDQIAVNITFYFPNGGMRSRDYDFRLIDENMKWIGTRKGSFFGYEFPINNEMRFPEKGITKVRIENKLTKFNNPGIVSIGLVMEKSTKTKR